MKILHFADVHLDRPFVGMSREAGRQRRNDLWEAFLRCLAAAREREVDLVTIGGDLWEDENVTADMRGSVAHELERVGKPVLLICGNHDPHLAGGHYERTPWPENVHVFRTDRPTEFRAGEVSLWGVSWQGGGRLDLGFLESLRVPADGRAHVLLLHGTARSLPVYLLTESDAGSAQGSRNGGEGGVAMSEGLRRTYGPFEPQAVERAGFALCLGGHIHNSYRTGRVVYPGSPEPLGWAEGGRHCYILAEVSAASTAVELFDVNRRRYEERAVVCDGASSGAAVAERVAANLVDPDAQAIFLRVDLVGQVAADCRIDLEDVASVHAGRYAELVLRDRTRPEYDLQALARQRTATGEFVRSMVRRIDVADDGQEREVLRLALQAGLHSLSGRRDVIRVD